MDCDRSKETLDIIFLICFYKLHNKINTNYLIETVLNSNSPKLFFEKFIIQLSTFNEYPYLVKESDIKSVLDKLNDPHTNDVSMVEDKVDVISTLKEKNIIAEKLVEKFNYLNTNDFTVKDKFNMMFWAHKALSRNTKEDEKNLDNRQQNLRLKKSFNQ